MANSILTRYIPFLSWLPSYQKDWLRADVVAGLTAAAVVIPKAMAYAVIAGLPVEAGLYTALAAMLIYPLLGTSRPLSVTTTSAIAMLTAAQIVVITTAQTGASASAVASTLALLVGGVLIIARLLRLGFLANFISKPVLIGFEAGVGVVILIGQMKSVLGVHVTSKTSVGALLELPGLLPQVHGVTAFVALIGIVVLISLPRLFPKLSAPLIWVALSIAASAVFGLEALGVKSVGTVPSGLPSLALPDLSLVTLLWPAALGIALMSFTESAAAARTFCARNDAPVNANQELLAIGAANVASAMVGGLPAGGGASQTAVADKAGVSSQMAQWINAAVVLLSLLLLSRVIGLLPQAALGALILVASVSMIKPETFRAIVRIRRMELIWALVTLAGVIFIGTLEGILIAVAISILTLFYQANHPPVYAVAYNRQKGIFRRAGDNESDETFPGLLMLRTEGRLTFANAENARDKMKALVAQTEPRVMVLECSAIPDIEYTALLMLTEAEENLRSRGITLWLAAVNPDLLKIIERSPLGAALGHERMFFNLRKALEAWQGQSAHGQEGKRHV
ncbi:MAG: SulP family inorganic anion transporter [Nitrospirae bacterium]|nr:SulP family inorganic anion transporter [Nitrospirota bacterium]